MKNQYKEHTPQNQSSNMKKPSFQKETVIHKKNENITKAGD